MKFRWLVAPQQPLLAGQLASSLQLSPLLAQCLLNRGFSETAAISGFLDPRLRQLSDPFLLPNMTAAVERLYRAREQKETVVVFGDYDVDGVTSTALLIETLNRLGWKTSWYLPNRMEEGYGLSSEAVDNCLSKCPATLIVALDCGSTSVECIAALADRGVDVIVVDHHQLALTLPAAVALVNPQLKPTNGATKDQPDFTVLCSAGLTFKLAHALVKRGRDAGLPEAVDFDLRPLLDLVALGTVADIVPLTGENRILVAAGLHRLNCTQRPGLVALKQVAQCASPLGTYEIGFQLAPRLNAAGRLETATEALELLLADNVETALHLARSLDRRNRERQAIERGIAESLIGSLQSRFNPESDLVIVEGEEPWHIGVVGIVASRVVQRFYRPTIIIGGDGAHWRGSGRSIAGFDLAAALRDCSDLLIRHGGHAMAAGLTLQATNLQPLRTRLNELARRALSTQDLQPPLRLDAEVGLEEMTTLALTAFARLKPVGQGNPAVQFFTRNLTHRRPLQRIGSEKQHVKMWITDGLTTHEAVWWGAGNGSLPVGRFDLAYDPQINHYDGQRNIQLKVLDWRASA
jgi:single-stranded-DNA-specific exonuclease